MQSLLLMAAPLAVFCVLTGGAIWLGLRRIENAAHGLQELGRRFNLEVVPRPKALGFIPQVPEVQGPYRGKYIRFYSFTTGSGKSRTHWAAVSAAPPEPTGLTLRISRQGVGSKVRALFGAQEIQLGDTAFDRRWFIETNAPDFVRAAILPEVQTRIDRVSGRSRSGAYEIVAGAVRYAEVGGFDRVERCERFGEAMESVCDLADIAEVYGRHARSAS